MAGCNRLCLLLIFWSVVAVTECYDVTTIYRYEKVEGLGHDNGTEDIVFNSLRGSVEIHARTNALGLPFMLHNASVINPGIGVDIPECTALHKQCDWTLDEWYVEDVCISNKSTLQPPLHLWREPAFGSCENIFDLEINEYLPSTALNGNKLIFSYKMERYEPAAVTIFLMEAGDIDETHMYVVVLHSEETPSLLKCGPTGEDSAGSGPLQQHIFPNRNARYCTNILNVYNFRNIIGYSESHSYQWLNFTLEITKSRIAMSVNYKGQHDLFNWTDTEPIPVNYYSWVITNDDYQYGTFLIPEGSFPFLALSSEEGSLTSPVFVPTSSQLCVVVTYYLSPGSGNILEVHVHSASHKLIIARIQAHKILGQWRTARFVTDIPLEDHHKPVQLFVTGTKSENSEILIQRIFGCNAEDGEDVAVLSADGPIPVQLIGHNVAVNKQLSTGLIPPLLGLDPALKCVNGGIYNDVDDKCKCPVGFTGSFCEDGCGPNRYGNDCGGMCSKSVTGCRGMLLCRPQMLCSCAPGIKGVLCDTSCAVGDYGAGCSQRCGSCIGWPCDPYTGACVGGCESGYYPPLCKKTYKFISTAPEVLVNGFYELSAVNIGTDDTIGHGTPRFVQLQYKDKLSGIWLELEPLLLSSDLVAPTINITGLLPGVVYHVRTVLIDKDGSSYQGEMVPYTEVQTRCTVPNSSQYNLEGTHTGENSFQVKWSYFPETTWCTLVHFEVHLKEGWRWFVHSKGTIHSARVTHKLAGSEYPMKVRAITSNGPANFSPILKMYTRDQTPNAVVNLRVVSEKSSELQVSWDQPWFTAGKVRRYHITYQCVNLLACSVEKCSQSASSTDATTTSTILRGLLPHAQYNISVAAYTGSVGPAVSILGATDYTVPSITPCESNSTVSQRTNMSFTVHWRELHSCRGLNGFLHGYRYELTLAGASPRTILLEGITRDLHISFTDLIPHTEYEIRVYLISSGGYSTQHPLVISAKTKPTIPDTVEHLTVYKRSRRMLGVRWAPPALTYGVLESFTVTYQVAGAANSISSTIKPTPCVAWPHLFCHTISLLRSDTKYIVTVQARNSDVKEDGEPTSITAVTREASPGPPKHLQLIKQTSSSLAVQWQLPYMLNGILWSFVINIEEIDSFNSTDCCQRFSLQEVPMNQERSAYDFEVTGLRPASKYTIGVSGKTISLGPAVSLTAFTRPPVPEMEPKLQVDLNIQPSESLPVTLQPSTLWRDLTSGYLLLVLPQDADFKTIDAILWDKNLEQELKDTINRPFYIAAEFQQADLEENPVTYVGTGRPVVDGALAQVKDPALTSGGTYKIAQVTILDYFGARNFGYILSDSFTMP